MNGMIKLLYILILLYFASVAVLPGPLHVCPLLPEFTAGPCADFCSFDYDCKEEEKCCSNGCGYQCMPYTEIEIIEPERVGPSKTINIILF